MEAQWYDGSTIIKKDSQIVSLQIRGVGTGVYSYKLTNVRTESNLALIRQTVNAKQFIEKWKHLRGIEFAAVKDAQPKILIGQNYIHLTVPREVREGPVNAPMATRTKLGWVLHGNTGMVKGTVDRESIHHICHKEEFDKLHQLVKDSFKIEAIGVKIADSNLLSVEEKRVKEITELTTRKVNNRWETGLLWKTDNVIFPESKYMAEKRLLDSERKMDTDPVLANEYCQKIDDYLAKGYARKLTEDEVAVKDDKIYYLPHFAHFNPNKARKLRLVFDAASKSHGVSLNDNLLKGVDLLKSLPSCLCTFRQKEIAILGDIEEMFLRVNIRKEDCNAQRFLWRGMNRDKPPEVYQMPAMIFGASSSPYSAQEVKNRNAKQWKSEYPAAAKAITDHHYMDDYCDSTDTIAEAKQLIEDVCIVHAKGGFNIRNFILNSKEVLKSLNPDKVTTKVKVIGETETEKILGMHWNPETDDFTFTTSFSKINKKILSGEARPTKRDVLKLTMTIFDVLGFLAQFTIKARILLQEIWGTSIGWDDELPTILNEKWGKWIAELQGINNVRVPRWYGYSGIKSQIIQLHVFCDASQQVYSAVCYFRIEDARENVKVSFVLAKARVAPVKIVSIPRWELQGALMGSRMAATIKKDHEFKIHEVYFWTDSSTVLYWMRSAVKKHRPFEAHRIGEISELTDIQDWHWIPTKLNVADDATRDDKPSDFSPEGRWFGGPEFLRKEKEFWPQEKLNIVGDGLEPEDSRFSVQVINTWPEISKELITVITSKKKGFPVDIGRYSSLLKVIRITAWILRFVNRLKNLIPKIHSKVSDQKLRPRVTAEKKLKLKSTKRSYSELTVQELEDSHKLVIRSVQKEMFPGELYLLKKLKFVLASSKISQLSPMLNDDGIIVMKGRTYKSPELPAETKFPIILDNNHVYTKLLIQSYHEKAGHHGIERIVNELRQQYWIIKIRIAVKSIWNSCQKCKVDRAKPGVPEMGALPEYRLTRQIRPFVITGLDYFGPLEVAIGRRREKRWVALFTCMNTRAVHLELASFLNTESAIMAIRRFMARRGNPKEIHSDNGSNFHGADNEMKSALLELDQDEIESQLSKNGIQWRFNPPSAPHMGGSWERLVQCVKKALKVTLKERVPREETLITMLAEAEATVNGRPLTHVSVSEEDEESLTPNHFLIGSSNGRNQPGVFTERDLNLRRQWRISQALADRFWSRWVKEYLPSLTRRDKWHKRTAPVKVGDLVFIVDGDLPRNHWPRGKVTEIFPGKDGQVRVVEVKTKTGSYKRPVVKIAVIDVEPEVVTGQESRYGRGNVPAGTTKSELDAREPPGITASATEGGGSESTLKKGIEEAGSTDLETVCDSSEARADIQK